LRKFLFTDGTDIVNCTPKRHRLHPNVTEVGSERPINTAGSQQHGHQSQSLQLFGPNVQPRHCVIAHTEGIVTVTPCSGNAETYVNGQRIYETTILQVNGSAGVTPVLSVRLTDIMTGKSFV
jgi:afadin